MPASILNQNGTGRITRHFRRCIIRYDNADYTGTDIVLKIMEILAEWFVLLRMYLLVFCQGKCPREIPVPGFDVHVN